MHWKWYYLQQHEKAITLYHVYEMAEKNYYSCLSEEELLSHLLINLFRVLSFFFLLLGSIIMGLNPVHRCPIAMVHHVFHFRAKELDRSGMMEYCDPKIVEPMLWSFLSGWNILNHFSLFLMFWLQGSDDDYVHLLHLMSTVVWNYFVM